MSKIAIIYYSMTGNIEYVAEKIQEQTKGDLIKMIPKKEYPNSGFKKFFWGGKSAVMKETPTLEDYQFNDNEYDQIIIGTPVWASTYAPPIRTFIKENKDVLKNKKISIFISCSGGNTKKTIEHLQKDLGINSFEEVLSLVDPKEKDSEENNQKIKEFCKKVNR